MNKNMKIQLLHNQECHVWLQFLPRLEKYLLKLGVPVQVEVILIQTDQEAEELRFAGSPTLLVNGVDVDPMAANVKRFQASGCRVYRTEDGVEEEPSFEMIKQALYRK